ncbi:hypothetical protein ABEV74_00640 [Paenibacillus cisolokensis]|jgi:hypothetical protein|uniref:Uncharacterized protein n=1 Tax=Paenibacillus cisolokensis TaxID=1658519 RepID=A0ABQ4NBR4_9BACL|nr:MULTISPECIES: hypothetical protein [Paenibacillus]ALS27477.1 hypothetical protein IJ21_20800 [Paenibacillus sp. 32O-W]GIQ65663.1 hypothetical protein PACILC2_42310 [Paenibacillus cisolokensis]
MEDYDRLEESKWKTFAYIALYSIVCGSLLAMFALTANLMRYVFSLLALYLGIRFFRRYERLAPRIWFIVLAIFWYFGSTIVIAMIAYIRENPPPA